MASVVQIASPFFFFFVFVFKIILIPLVSSSEIYLALSDEYVIEDDEYELGSKERLLLLMMILMMVLKVVDVRLYRA